MKHHFFKFLPGFFALLFSVCILHAQPSFVSEQRSYAKIADVFDRKVDSLKTEFEAKKLAWPPKGLYIRSFKYEQVLEVWVKETGKEQFKLFKTYKVCQPSGIIGPKRKEGDLQVPEGFYYINEFNPNSSYHLSLGLNYPNSSDRILSDSLHPGGEIYIHGNCVSVGCIPIADMPIEELYVLGSYARSAGQDFIPVHVFPVKYDDEKSIDHLYSMTETNPMVKKFALKLKEAFDYFKEKKQLPVILVNSKGEYVIN